MLPSVALLYILLFQVEGFGPKLNKDENFEQLYSAGKEAYLSNDFSGCVQLMEAALLDYKYYTEIITRCKLDCQTQIPSQSAVIQHIQEMMPFEKLIRETLCLMKCKEGKIPQTRDEFASESTRADFERKKPYDYLQLCYYKTDQLQKAAKAAYTHHIYNMEYLITKENLDFYLAQAGVEVEDLVDVEESDYVRTYLAGRSQYGAEDWEAMVVSMEEALQEFLRAEDFCRTTCDKPFDMGCDVLVGRLKEASEAAGTALYLQPDSEEMKVNLEFYRGLEDTHQDWFKPRQEAISYVQRDNDEEALLTFIETQFTFNNRNRKEARNQDEDHTEGPFTAKWSTDLIEDNEDSGVVVMAAPEPQPPPVVKFSW